MSAFAEVDFPDIFVFADGAGIFGEAAFEAVGVACDVVVLHFLF